MVTKGIKKHTWALGKAKVKKHCTLPLYMVSKSTALCNKILSKQSTFHMARMKVIDPIVNCDQKSPFSHSGTRTRSQRAKNQTPPRDRLTKRHTVKLIAR